MWRDKESKKPVYLQITNFYKIDKNGDCGKCLKAFMVYYCESWLGSKEMELEELRRLAEWVEENE